MQLQKQSPSLYIYTFKIDVPTKNGNNKYLRTSSLSIEVTGCRPLVFSNFSTTSMLMIVEKQIRNSWDADHYMHQSARGYDVNTIIKQTKLLSRELDKKNDTLCKFMISNVLKHFENTFFQNDIVSESSRQPPDVSKTLVVVF